MEKQLHTGAIGSIQLEGLAQVRPKIVAVDGPAGSGKSSICYKISGQLGWSYINTGALYRAIGVLALAMGIDLDDEQSLAAMIDRISGDLRWDQTERELWYGEQNLTAKLQSEEAGYGASKVAKQNLVREKLLPVQRLLTLASKNGALVDGRDIGTVVFPDADLKIFLTASLEERSRRRMHQLGAEHIDPEALEDVKKGIARRDERDEHRSVAPLKQADDAVVVDTSHLSIDETVAVLVKLIKEQGLLT